MIARREESLKRRKGNDSEMCTNHQKIIFNTFRVKYTTEYHIGTDGSMIHKLGFLICFSKNVRQRNEKKGNNDSFQNGSLNHLA